MDTKKVTDYYLAPFKKYAVFSGRAQRAEYWYFVLFNFIISMILSYIDRLGDNGLSDYMVSMGIFGGIFTLIILIPGIAVAVRRLHDIGKSGWWILISLIPLIGWIWFLVLMATEGNPEANEYGPNPKAEANTPVN